MTKSQVSSTPDHAPCTPAFFPRPTETRIFDRWLTRWDGRTGERLSNIRYVVSHAAKILWLSWFWSPLVRGIVRELRSTVQRIAKIHATKLYLYRVTFRSLQTLQTRIGYAPIQACSEDTQEIAKTHRWATTLDLLLFVEGWRAGAEWALGSTRSESKDNEQQGHGAFRTIHE